MEKTGATVEIGMENPFKAVNIHEDSETVRISREALKKAGIQARTDFMTGFTDASIYNNKGIEMAVVGIGARLEHSPEEHIYIADMEKAVVMISSEMPELLGMCDRIYVMNEGEFVGELNAQDATQERIMSLIVTE